MPKKIEALTVPTFDDVNKDGDWYHILIPTKEVCEAQLIRWDFYYDLWQTLIIPNDNRDEAFAYFMYEDGVRFSETVGI